MTRHAIIDPQTWEVVNVIIWEGAEWLPPRGYMVVQADICDIGDHYDNQTNTIIRADRTQRDE